MTINHKLISQSTIIKNKINFETNEQLHDWFIKQRLSKTINFLSCY